MKSVFDFADRQGLIQENVMRKIKRLPEEAPEIRPFTLEEVNRLIRATHFWYKPYLTMAFFTGMRAGEQNGLMWSDVLSEMKPPRIFINKTYVYGKESSPKTKKSKRYIQCLPRVLDALEEQLMFTGEQEYIFLTSEGRRMTPDHLRKEVWVPALKRAGMEYRPPLQTRHTFATMMLTAGEDIGWVQNMLGHSSLQMIFTRYYAWIPSETRSDGQAFARYAERTEPGDLENPHEPWPQDASVAQEYPNIITLDAYRRKKGA